MRTESFSGTVEAYQGKTLPTPINFSGSVELYENLTEAKNSEDWLSENEILKVINTKRVTAAKAAEYQKATKKLKEDYENTWEFKRANLIKAALATEMFTQAEAEAM